MIAALILSAVLVVILVVVVLYCLAIQNELVTLRNNIDYSLSGCDSVLKQRHDELPKLIGTCRGYMEREQKTLQALIQARAAFARATSAAEKAQASEALTGALRALFGVANNYPELTTNRSFLQLRGRLTALEGEIAAQGARYNEEVRLFNTGIAGIPARFVARLMHLKPREFFRAPRSTQQDLQVKTG